MIAGRKRFAEPHRIDCMRGVLRTSLEQVSIRNLVVSFFQDPQSLMGIKAREVNDVRLQSLDLLFELLQCRRDELRKFNSRPGFEISLEDFAFGIEDVCRAQLGGRAFDVEDLLWCRIVTARLAVN